MKPFPPDETHSSSPPAAKRPALSSTQDCGDVFLPSWPIPSTTKPFPPFFDSFPTNLDSYTF